MYRPEVPPEMIESFKVVEFADVLDTNGEVEIDILIGLDAYWKFIKPQILSSVPNGLMAQLSVFGWVLYGTIPNREVVDTGTVSTVSSHQLLCFNIVSEQISHKQWDLEKVGVVDRDHVVSDPVLESFNTNLRFACGRYTVSLPWKVGLKDRLIVK